MVNGPHLLLGLRLSFGFRLAFALRLALCIIQSTCADLDGVSFGFFLCGGFCLYRSLFTFHSESLGLALVGDFQAFHVGHGHIVQIHAHIIQNIHIQEFLQSGLGHRVNAVVVCQFYIVVAVVVGVSDEKSGGHFDGLRLLGLGFSFGFCLGDCLSSLFL